MGSASSRTRTLQKNIPKPALPKLAEDPPNPNLLSNLAQLGQVRVQNPQTPTPTPTPIGHNIPTQPDPFFRTPNTLSAPALATLLDKLKSHQHAPTLAHAKQLVHQQQFNLDWDVYQRLAKYVNTPSIGRQNHIQLTDNSVRILKEVIWVDPAYTRTSPSP